ncbi:MAG: hypothetical protein HY689_15655, partial [Chloroflexi bacterium]|nr:hypothetical protein [Chloroflexota bacterium]
SPALSPRAFAVGLVAAALGLLLLCELVYLRDVFNNRMNTVFKVSYQAWAFLAVASAFGLYYGHAAGRWGRGRSVVLGGLAVALLAAFIYVPMALFNRTEAFSRPPTLDGLAFVDSDQRAAVDWLWTATAGQRAVILEASGPQYSGFALMSSRTGLPTLLGWPGHEVQWRGPLPVFNERQGAIDRIYQAPDKAAVLGLLKQYGVGYVIVGPAERSVYSAAGLDAFDAALEVVFRQGAVTIYRVPGRVGRTAG